MQVTGFGSYDTGGAAGGYRPVDISLIFEGLTLGPWKWFDHIAEFKEVYRCPSRTGTPHQQGRKYCNPHDLAWL